MVQFLTDWGSKNKVINSKILLKNVFYTFLVCFFLVPFHYPANKKYIKEMCSPPLYEKRQIQLYKKWMSYAAAANPISIKHADGLSCMNNCVFTQRMPQRSTRLQEGTTACAAWSKAQHETSVSKLTRSVRLHQYCTEMRWNFRGFKKEYFSSVDRGWGSSWPRAQLEPCGLWAYPTFHLQNYLMKQFSCSHSIIAVYCVGENREGKKGRKNFKKAKSHHYPQT